MSDGTKISWTDASWNPVRAKDSSGTTGWACVRVSPGCEHCYAEAMNRRLGAGQPYTVPGMATVTPFLDEKALVAPLRWRKPRRVFAGSMTDLFGEWVPDAWIDRVFAVMAFAEDHTFQVLTKRADRMRAYLLEPGTRARVTAIVREMDRTVHGAAVPRGDLAVPLPLDNVWLGVSAEDQRRADERIPELLATPAAMRFVSCEPLLGPIDLKLGRGGDCGHCNAGRMCLNGVHAEFPKSRLNWVIAGAESGPNRRPFDVEWALSLQRQCEAAGVAFWGKQGPGPRSEAPFGHPLLDAPEARAFPAGSR